IEGIDRDKCIKCLECVRECPSVLFSKDDSGTIVFNDPNLWCISCGHCIAVCPEDAILFSDMGEEPSTFDEIGHPASLIGYENLLKVFQSKRSVRRYKDEQVALKDLKNILEAIRYYASSSNMRSLKFRLISDKETIMELSDAIIENLMENPAMKSTYGDKITQRRGQGRDPIFHGAPHVLIMSSGLEMNMEFLNAGVAGTYGMLAAQSLGVGSCWIGLAQIAMNQQRKIRKLAGSRGTIKGVIVLGYPAVKYHATAPRPSLKVKGLDA
ncbi:4Fe-4S dicluster domain-containing protein, partial [Candidatus Bathyarchaeota archaeon]|nr:4Fe-4S dicluster domain-containing protein [Candidatus Bathyarchaeota archaeon]